MSAPASRQAPATASERPDSPRPVPVPPERIPPEGNEGAPVGTGTPLPHGTKSPSSGIGGAKKG